MSEETRTLLPAREAYNVLQGYLQSAPQWLCHAYNNLGRAHRIMQESAMVGLSKEEMLMNLCEALYSDLQTWQKQTMADWRQSGVPIVTRTQKEA